MNKASIICGIAISYSLNQIEQGMTTIQKYNQVGCPFCADAVKSNRVFESRLQITDKAEDGYVVPDTERVLPFDYFDDE